MTHEQIDRMLMLGDRYVAVQEATLQLSLERVRALAITDERMSAVREREAVAAEKQASKVIEITGNLKGDMRQTVVRESEAGGE